MDELDSNFPEFLLYSEEPQIFDLSESESFHEHKEETVIDTRHEESEGSEANEEDKKKRNRDDNTAFKTPLSEFRKIMKEILKSDHESIKIMDEINKKKNASTFFKFLRLSQHLKIKDKLKEPFRVQMEKILVKKKNKLPQKRFEELEKVYQRMKRSLECDNLEGAMEEYWGRYRQKSKFEKSCKEIENFGKKLETMNLIKIKNNEEKSGK